MTKPFNIIVIGVRNEAKLQSVATEAASHGIKWLFFVEPDMGHQTTAMATEPLDDEKKKVFARYRLLKEV